jgi:hypothetical protein
MKPPTRVGAREVPRAAQGCGFLHFVGGWPARGRCFAHILPPYKGVCTALTGASA